MKRAQAGGCCSGVEAGTGRDERLPSEATEELLAEDKERFLTPPLMRASFLEGAGTDGCRMGSISGDLQADFCGSLGAVGPFRRSKESGAPLSTQEEKQNFSHHRNPIESKHGTNKRGIHE